MFFKCFIQDFSEPNNNLSILKQGSWIVGTLQNGWTGNIQYAKNGLGLVTVKADVIVGTNSADTVICTLPEGYRANMRIPISVQVIPTSTGVHGLYVNDSGGLIRVSANNGLSAGQNIRFMIIYNIN